MIGLGSSASFAHKDILKLARSHLGDKSLPVRSAAAKCCLELSNHSLIIYTSELDGVVTNCLKALDGSSYDVRSNVAGLLGTLVAKSQQQKNPASVQTKGKVKWPSLDEVLGLMSNGFLKGSGELLKSAVSREVRIGVTEAYTVFFSEIGGVWVEKNLAVIFNHLLLLLSHQKAISSHIDAVYSRKCIAFILRWILTRLLSESSQLQGAKIITGLISQVVTTLVGTGSGTESGQHEGPQAMQHVLSCAFVELGFIICQLGTAALSLVTDSHQITEVVHCGVSFPSNPVRLAAAWCLRSIALALPSQLTLFLRKCMEKLTSDIQSPDVIMGYSYAVAALLGAVRECPLGIPFAQGKEVFHLAEDLLRNVLHNRRLSLAKTQAGWTLLSAVITLGSSVAKHHLPRLLLLWRNAFPRSPKELEVEKAQGDAFSWHVTLEGRAGALNALRCFVICCKDLINEDVIKRLLAPIEGALSMLPSLSALAKSFGTQLKASAALVKLRLNQALVQLPPKSFEGSFSALLRELVAEFTLAENPANTSTSLLRSMCHQGDTILLGSWLEETDHKLIEDQLQPNSAAGSGALEHDPTCVYLCPEGSDIFGPLPLGVTVIDSSVALFGCVFPHIALKHRQQLVTHFGDCIRQAKSSRQQAVQLNIFTAFLAALKALVESKSTLGSDDIIETANSLILGALASSDVILRCAAGEALGRLAQVVSDSKFVAVIVQGCFDKLKTARDAVSRTGHSLVLGCLHRYVGGLGSGQHITASVSILHALAQDVSSPVVQIWALHALALITDSGGPMFRGYVEPTLSLILSLLLSVSMSNVEVFQCLGQCLAALITSVGPELQGSSITTQFLVGCAVLNAHPDPVVRASATSCLQQLQLFAPQFYSIADNMPSLCVSLVSKHLLLRRAAVAFLKQLSHRQVEEVTKHANSPVSNNSVPNRLEETLFTLLDTETDIRLVADVKDILSSMVASLASKNPKHWLGLCHRVLMSTSTVDKEGGPRVDEEDEGEDAARFTAPTEDDVGQTKVGSRWTTKVFAVECIRKMMSVCSRDKAHTDLALARKTGVDYLVCHLAELVRTFFIAATGNVNKLRLVGLDAIEEVIKLFAESADPDWEGHSVFEQYQAQVSAALRPAFATDTPPDVTARACQVCSTWLSCGVCRDVGDLRRIQQLLVTSLQKVRSSQNDEGKPKPAYNESTLTMEKLAVLKAWAEIYIEAKSELEKLKASRQQSPSQDNGSFSLEDSSQLIEIVKPELKDLSKHWLAALRDHALLGLPSQFALQLPPDGGAFYSADTMDSARPHYRSSWTAFLQAAALWLADEGFNSQPSEPHLDQEHRNAGWFHLLLGLCVEALVSPIPEDCVNPVMASLISIAKLLSAPWPRQCLGSKSSLAIEVLAVIHRVVLTHHKPEHQALAATIVNQIISATVECLRSETNPDEEPVLKKASIDDLAVGKSVVFGALQVAICLLFQRYPSLRLVGEQQGGESQRASVVRSVPTPDTSIASIIDIFPKILILCEEAASVNLLPSILMLIVKVLEENVSFPSPLVSACVQGLQAIMSKMPSEEPTVKELWLELLRSTYVSLLEMIEKQLPNTSVAGPVLYSNVLVVLGSVLLVAPDDVTAVKELQEKCCKVFDQGIKDPNIQVRLKVVQTMAAVIAKKHKSTAVPLIHSLGPTVIQIVQDASGKQLNSEEELALLKECVGVVELLVSVCEETHRKSSTPLYFNLNNFCFGSTFLFLL
jgi:hypothetical protein